MPVAEFSREIDRGPHRRCRPSSRCRACRLAPASSGSASCAPSGYDARKTPSTCAEPLGRRGLGHAVDDDLTCAWRCYRRCRRGTGTCPFRSAPTPMASQSSRAAPETDYTARHLAVCVERENFRLPRIVVRPQPSVVTRLATRPLASGRSVSASSSRRVCTQTSSPPETPWLEYPRAPAQIAITIV